MHPHGVRAMPPVTSSPSVKDAALAFVAPPSQTVPHSPYATLCVPARSELALVHLARN